MEGEGMALTASRERHPDRVCEQIQAHRAEWFKRCLTAREKAMRQSDSTMTTQVEFVCRDWQDDYDCRWSSTPHRIIKRTKTRIYIDRDAHSDRFEERRCGDWRDFANQRVIVLDRQKLAQEGSAWSRTVRDRFYTTPHEERRHRFVPESGKLLGLTVPWTTDQVKQAFRFLVKKAHPDSGGDGDEFKKLYRAYEEALEIAVNRVAS
jgi:hypothetical protein